MNDLEYARSEVRRHIGNQWEEIVKAGFRLGLAGALLAMLTAVASAEKVLRIEDIPIGELDPAKAADVADSILMFNVYDTLVLANQGKSGVGPLLAKSWKVDGSDFTFTLRDDVIFHTGNPLTSDDVVYSFQRFVALGQGLSHLLRGHVKSVTAVDEHTVKFSLEKPYAPFLTSLTRLPVIDSKSAKANTKSGTFGDNGDYAQAYLTAHDLGTGAYRIVSHNPQEATEFARNDKYFLAFPDGAPDRVTLRYGLDAATIRTLLARGELDISSQWLAPEIMSSLAKEPGMKLVAETSLGNYSIKLNTQRAPLDDVHCRRAIADAIDYQALLSLAKLTNDISSGTPANGPIPAGVLGADSDLPYPKKDMDKARKELKQCAHDPAASKIVISWISEIPVEEKYALLMQANFQELGFKTEVVRMPWAFYTQQTATPGSTPHIGQLFSVPTLPDPDALLYNTYHSSVRGTYASSQWLVDSEVDNLLDAGRATFDEAEREKIYRKLDARLVELQPNIFGYNTKTVRVVRDGIHITPLEEKGTAYSQAVVNLMFRNITIK